MLYQSSYVGLKDFLEALLTENRISGRVHNAKYNSLYLVESNLIFS